MTNIEFLNLLAQFRNGGDFIISETISLPDSVLFSGGLIFGDNSTLIFRGGRFKNTSSGIMPIKANGLTIIANPVQIFEGNFDFKALNGESQHYWNMECAYPQWFGAKSCADKISESKIDAAPDASEAINAAIRLKRVGRVMIPAGFYKITRFINVLPGIILEGETPRFGGVSHYGTVLFPWHNLRTEGEGEDQIQTRNPKLPTRDKQYIIDNIDGNSAEIDVACMDFPPHPGDVDWYNQEFSSSCDSGYMMLACMSDKCTVNFEAGSNYPKSISYAESPTAQPRVAGTEIRNIAFTTKLHGVAEHRYMRAILMAGAVKLSQVRTYNLSQLCCSMLFSDERYVERCSFAPPSFAQNPQTSDYNWGNYPQKIYAIDLEGGGDAMNLIGNHVATYSEKIGALKVRSCNGGSITGNILNSDVLIELCRGIDFAANHMEYGSRITITSSTVAVRSNSIWKGSRPAITIRRYENIFYPYYHSNVTLDSNHLHWRSQHTAGQPQAAQSLCHYDVATDGYAAINIANSFRTCTRHYDIGTSSFGIKMEWLEMKDALIDGNHGLVELEENDPTKDYCVRSDFDEFNRISHIASLGCKVQGRNVIPAPAAISSDMFAYRRGNEGSAIVQLQVIDYTVRNAEADGWKAEVGVNISYEAWIFADYKRRIVMRKHITGASQIITAANKNYRIQIGHGEATNFGIPAGPYMAFVVRTTSSNGTVQNRNGVLLPVCNSTEFWDDGRYLSGFEWEAISQSGINALSSSSNVSASRVIYHGANVECICNDAVPKNEIANTLQINGSWLEGDIIREMDGGQVVSWLKTASGWKTI